MNVYVRELASALALAGGRSTVFTRRVEPSAPTVVEVEPGFRVVHVDAGEPDLSKEELEGVVGPFTDGVAAHLDADPSFDGLLANYWLSGVAGHRLKHQLDLPLTTIFHTLARVKAETGDLEPQRRVDAEAEVVGCSDVILASSAEEVRQLVDHYGAEASRIEIVPPGVDHAYFSPGPRAVARRITGLGYGPVLAFVGRIQPLKGLDVAVAKPGRSGSSGCPTGGGWRGQWPRRPLGRAADSRPGRRPWLVQARALHPTPAPPPPFCLVPGGRRGGHAEPLGVVWACRPRGLGLRDPCCGCERRRPAEPR